jgi:hypothetical protein
MYMIYFIRMAFKEDAFFGFWLRVKRLFFNIFYVKILSYRFYLGIRFLTCEQLSTKLRSDKHEKPPVKTWNHLGSASISSM